MSSQNSNKSVVIIGKGPSVQYSSKEFIDSFDEVAICNFPPMEKYQHLISNRAHYHFFNAGNYLPYDKQFINNLGLRKMFNTQAHWENPKGKFIKKLPTNILPDYPVEYEWDYGIKLRKKYENKYGFWPSTGVMAFDYFLNSDDHSKICLVGFDFFSIGESVYYFSKEETVPTIHYLWGKIYSEDGKVLPHDEAHGGELSKETVLSLIEQSTKTIFFKTKPTE